MIKKSIIAVLIGTTALMTACSGGGATAGSNMDETTENVSDISEPVNNVTVTDEEAVEEVVNSETFEMPVEEVEMNGEILTIRLDRGSTKEGFSWSFYRGDKGDASLVQLLTESDSDGVQYAGSFRALEDSGDDFIRLVYSNDTYVYAYIDVDVEIKDKAFENYMITEVNPMEKDMINDLIVGTWQQENDGTIFLEISENPSDGYDMVISDGSEGSAVYDTMTAYYDILKGALVYTNSTENAAEITDGQEAENSEAAEGQTEEGTDLSEEQGHGAFILTYDESASEITMIEWIDMTDSHDPICFVK